jgi:hypothetical protein
MDTCRTAVLLQLEDEESVVFGKSLRRRAAGLMKWNGNSPRGGERLKLRLIRLASGCRRVCW